MDSQGHNHDSTPISSRSLRDALESLRNNFIQLKFESRQKALLTSLGIPENAFPEFEEPKNFQNLLFFLFVNQGFALFTKNQIQEKDISSNIFSDEAIASLQKEPFFRIIFQPNLFQEIRAQNPALLEQLLQVLKSINLQNLISLDNLGTLLQDYLGQAARKRFAANYTDLEPATLLAGLAVIPEMKAIIDPMGGSGRLIFSSLDALLHQGVSLQDAIPRMILNELFLPAVQLFCGKLLILLFSDAPQDYKILQKCRIFAGDAFTTFQTGPLDQFAGHNPSSSKVLGSCDLVIMNPPFTRQGILEAKYRDFLARRFSRYGHFLSKHMGLHGYALFLAHELLTPGGYIAAVLPASTIISGYGEGLKKFLLQHYHVQIVLASAVTKAFSEGSDFREIILVCQKKIDSRTEDETPPPLVAKFVTIKKQLQDLDLPKVAAGIRAAAVSAETEAYKIIPVQAISLAEKRNWLYFFEDTGFKQLYGKLREVGKFISSNQAGLRLVRGFEMYGPNYFLLPNKYWKVSQVEHAFIEISKTKNETQKLQIPREFLQISLRKPEECQPQICFTPEHYALAVPEGTELPPPLKVYYEWGLQSGIPAIKRFEKKWFSHVHAQLESKQPFGRVFVADKFSVNGLHNFAYYFPDKITCTKNFYVFQAPDAIADDFLAAWLNSTVFLFLFLAERREIGGSYGRLQIADYKAMPLFVKIDAQSPAFKKVLIAFRDLQAVNPLPLIHDQISLPARQALDDALLLYLGVLPEDIPALREQVYSAVKQKLESLAARD